MICLARLSDVKHLLWKFTKKSHPIKIFSLQFNPLVIFFLWLQFWFRERFEVSVGHSVMKLLHFDYSRRRCESVTQIVIRLQKLLCLVACRTAQGCLCVFGCPQGHWFYRLLSSSLSCTTSHSLHPHHRT